MATTDEILTILSGLARCYPAFELEKETIIVYTHMLKDIPADLLTVATFEYATHGRFFPSVAEIREKVYEISLQVSGIPSAYKAWDELLSDPGGKITRNNGLSLSERGEYIFSHPLAEKVARELGWPGRFPGNSNDTLMADRAHFLKAYECALHELMIDEMRLPEVKQYIESHSLPDVKQLAASLQEMDREVSPSLVQGQVANLCEKLEVK